MRIMGQNQPAVQIALLRDHPHLIADIADCLHEEWQSLPPWSSKQAIAERFLGYTQTPDLPLSLVALTAVGILLGTASIKLHELSSHPDKTHWMGEVFVLKDQRNRGIGKALVRAVISQAQSMQLPALYLYTPDQQKLYAQFGWKTVATQDIHGETVDIMVLPLA